MNITDEMVETACRDRYGATWDKWLPESRDAEREKVKSMLTASVSAAPAPAITNEQIEAARKAAPVHLGPALDSTIRGALIAGLSAAPQPAPQPVAVVDGLLDYYQRQIVWSRETFGPAMRTKGVIDHIRKELLEIENAPHDLSEWVDVVILAMDGFWRHGGNAEDLFPALLAKQRKNMARAWPDWRTMSEDTAIEHDRSGEAALAAPQPAPQPVAWQWRSRIKGGPWDAWENGRFGQQIPPFMEVEERALYTTPPADQQENERLKAQVVDAWNAFGEHASWTEDDIADLPIMAQGTLAEQIVELTKQRDAAEQRVKALEEALREEETWHEMHDKALSKQPPSGGPNGTLWARAEHQERLQAIRAALKGGEACD